MTLDGEPAVKLPPAYRLIKLDSVVSTMDEARRLAEEGAEDGTLIWAQEQTGGRGRQGRDWASPRGNLYLSIVLRPECSAAAAAQLSFVTAVALGEAIGKVAPAMMEVTYKWPNDVLVNGRKTAGILLESKGAAGQELDYLLLGMGVNLQSYPEETPFPATSLRFEGCAPDLTQEQLLEAFSRSFLSWVNRWVDDGFGAVRKAWLIHAAGKGEEIEVRLPNETLRGRFEDIDGDGHLLLGLPEGQRVISAGDVFPLR